MVVTSIAFTAVLVFVLVDLLLRALLTRFRARRPQRVREQALDPGRRLDVSEEAPTLKRVEREHPQARILAVDDEQIVPDSLRKMPALAHASARVRLTGSFTSIPCTAPPRTS